MWLQLPAAPESWTPSEDIAWPIHTWTQLGPTAQTWRPLGTPGWDAASTEGKPGRDGNGET